MSLTETILIILTAGIWIIVVALALIAFISIRILMQIKKVTDEAGQLANVVQIVRGGTKQMAIMAIDKVINAIKRGW